MLVLDGVGGEVGGTDVIAVDKSTPCERAMELLEELL
jgi:hypothetical protein